jgi:hypothetical protein
VKYLALHFPDDNAKSMGLIYLITDSSVMLDTFEDTKTQILYHAANSNCIHESPFHDYRWKCK